MALDPQTAAAAINAGGQTVNSLLGFITSKSDQRRALRNYQRQRNDALADWHMQNAYNSPAAQMQRLKEAGLNPHLVYGNGATATSETMPKQSAIEHVATEAPQFDAQSILGSYMNVKLGNAQADNLKVQKTVMEQEALLKSIQALNVLANTEKTKEETTNIKELRATTIEAAKKNVEKLTADIESTKANTFYTLQENMRKEQLQPITIRTMNEQIKNMAEQRRLSAQQRDEIIQRISNMVTEGKLKEWELEQRRKGINPNDPTWLKALYNEVLAPMFGLGKEHKPIMEQFKEGFNRNNKAAYDTIRGSIRKAQRKMGEYFNQVPAHY